MEESLLPAIIRFCEKFQTGAYANDAERYVHFLYLENQQFRQSMEGRDSKIISLMKEVGELRRKLGEKKW